MISSAKYINLHSVVFTMNPKKDEFEAELFLADKIDAVQPNLPYTYRLKQLLSPTQEHKDTTREFFGAYVKKNFVKKVAKEHLLDAVLSPEELKNAKKFGHLPERFAVHHILPISFGGKNHPSNLCVAEEMIHKALHQLVWDKIDHEFYWDKTHFPKAYMYVPTEMRVLTNAEMPLFFSPDETKQFKKRYRRWKRTMLAVRKWKEAQKKPVRAKRKKLPDNALNQKYFANKAKIKQQKKSLKKEEENPLLLPPQEAYFKLMAAKKEKINAYKKKFQKARQKSAKAEKPDKPLKRQYKKNTNNKKSHQKAKFFAFRRKKESGRDKS